MTASGRFSLSPSEHFDLLMAEGKYEEAEDYLRALAMFAKLDGVSLPVSDDSPALAKNDRCSSKCVCGSKFGEEQ